VKAIADRRHHRFAPAVLLMAALLVTGAVYAAFSPTAAGAADVNQSDVEAGRALFTANCATCHGPSAEGRGDIPSLIGVGAAAVDFQVSTGRMPMQASGPQAITKPPALDAEQTRQLAAYVASLAPGPAIPSAEQVDPAQGDAANGMALFRTNCAMCHGAIGSGGALTGGKFAPGLGNSTPTQIYEAMLSGPASMPVFNDANLSPEDKQDVIAFLDLQRAGSPGGTDLGALGPVSEGLWVWVVGMGLLIGCAVWIGAKSS
jgi:ubiquinol-cytochrome c reductase cytochrome c subunit